MKKILYVIPESSDFFASRLKLARAMKTREYNVHAAFFESALHGKMQTGEFNFHALGAVAKGFDIPAALRVAAALRRTVQKLKPDIVHVFTLKAALVAGLALRGVHPKPKIVMTVAGLGYLFGEGAAPAIARAAFTPLLRLAFSGAVVTAQNQDDIDQLRRAKIIARDAGILIPGSGIDMDMFAPRPDIAKDDPPMVLMPTRLLMDKGLKIFVEAANILHARGVNARFVIAGGVAAHNPRAVSEPEMKNLIAGSAAEWIGPVSDMPALYARSSIVLFPSWYREGIPRVVMEPAAMEIPVVTTDHPGCRDAVINGQTGILVPVRNAQAAADAVAALLGDAPRRAEMGKAARAHMMAHFSTEKIVAATLGVYDGAVYDRL